MSVNMSYDDKLVITNKAKILHFLGVFPGLQSKLIHLILLIDGQ